MRRKAKAQPEEGALLSALRSEKKILSAEIATRVERLSKVEELLATYEGKNPARVSKLSKPERQMIAKGGPFFGMALPAAVTKQLSTHTKPVTSRQLWEEMKEHYPTTSEDPAHAVHWALRRREQRVGDVMIVGEGKWAIRAWYSEEEQKRIDDSLGPMAGRDKSNHVAKTKEAMKAMKYRGVRVGAPVKMTPEIISKLRQLIENGMSVAEASKEVGIKPSTFYAHRTNGTFGSNLKVRKKTKGRTNEPDLLSRTGAVN